MYLMLMDHIHVRPPYRHTQNLRTEINLKNVEQTYEMNDSGYPQ